MPVPPLPDDIAALLARPNPAVMATVASDGRPVTVATWYLVEDDGSILLNLEDSRVRLQHLRADPRVSLTALAEDNWYTHVSVQGRVVAIVDDETLTDIDRLCRHYGGGDYPNRDGKRVSVHVEVERWHGWGAAKQD